MTRGRPLLPAVALGLLLALAGGAAQGVESDPLPVPAGGVRANAVRLYNEGVALLVGRKFEQAQSRLEAALALDDQFAEAHNNLAYALRMQGRDNFAASLEHYDRAVALKPGLAQAYMYRGVLFVQQGDMGRARQDLERLRALDPKLASELERVVEGGAASGTGNERGGIAAQYE